MSFTSGAPSGAWSWNAIARFLHLGGATNEQLKHGAAAAAAGTAAYLGVAGLTRLVRSTAPGTVTPGGAMARTVETVRQAATPRRTYTASGYPRRAPKPISQIITGEVTKGLISSARSEIKSRTKRRAAPRRRTTTTRTRTPRAATRRRTPRRAAPPRRTRRAAPRRPTPRRRTSRRRTTTRRRSRR